LRTRLPLLLLQVGHLDDDHHGEDPHDHPLHVADVKKVLDVVVILAGREAGRWLRVDLLGRNVHDEDSGVGV
jgi:hypothetical protein